MVEGSTTSVHGRVRHLRARSVRHGQDRSKAPSHGQGNERRARPRWARSASVRPWCRRPSCFPPCQSPAVRTADSGRCERACRHRGGRPGRSVGDGVRSWRDAAVVLALCWRAQRRKVGRFFSQQGREPPCFSTAQRSQESSLQKGLDVPLHQKVAGLAGLSGHDGRSPGRVAACLSTASLWKFSVSRGRCERAGPRRRLRAGWAGVVIQQSVNPEPRAARHALRLRASRRS
jgi:hypothetical protein